MTPTAATTIAVPAGSAALDALAAAIDTAKAGDPLAPVTVVVPSRYCALSARRALGGRGGDGAAHTGIVNVRFEVAARVAELLGAPRLARSGRRPRTSPVVAEAVRTAAAQAPAIAGPAALHPSTIDRLVRVVQELRVAGPEAVLRLTHAGGRAAALASFATGVEARLERWYDEFDLAEAAAEAVAAHHESADEVGTVIWWSPRPNDPTTSRLVGAFADRAVVIEPHAPERGDPVLRSGLTIVSVPDPDEEVRGAVRETLALAEAGIPLHRIAVAHPGGSYPALLDEQFTAAGVPHNGPPVRTLANTVAGTALLGLLVLAEGRFGRDEVISWLASVPVRDPSTNQFPKVARWDRESRRAGVVAGLDTWRDRLASHIAHLEARRTDDEAEANGAMPGTEDRIAATAQLRDFVITLAADLATDQLSSWSGWSLWAIGLLRRYLGGPAALARWPEPEHVAYDDVVARVRGLAELEELGSTPDLGAFRQAVEAELASSAGRIGTFGDGVFVGRIDIVGGLVVDAVVVVGAAEGLLPRGAATDPLLGEPERTVAGLPPAGGSVDEQASDFFSALAAGTRRRIVFTPRGDLRTGHVYLPSRWVLELAADLTGMPVRGDDLPGLAAAHPQIRTIASFADGLAQQKVSASIVDRDLAELWAFAQTAGTAARHPIVHAEPGLARAYAAETARASTRFTAFDGRVDPAAAPTLAADKPQSPTGLEHYAACPRRFFLGRGLGLSTVERPEAISEISARDRGSLVHEVLERWVHQRIGPPRREPSLEHLMEVAGEVFDEYEQRGLTGRPLRWQYDRRRIARELREVFERDVRNGHEPIAAEFGFGLSGGHAADDESDIGGEAPPLSVSIGHGEPVTFHGLVDRVDRREDGSLVVTDYKTGSVRPFKQLDETTTDRGTRLQLPIYGLVAKERFGDDDTRVRTRYWFVTDAAGYEEVGYDLDDDRRAAFQEALDVIVSGVRAGRFPARPGEPDNWSGTGTNCRWCDFDELCPADRFRQWERKREAPELRDYVALAEGPDGEADER